MALLLLLLGLSGGSPVEALSSPVKGEAAPVRGLVRDGAGAGVGRALVLLTPMALAEQVRAAQTDAEGRYFFPVVPQGTYRVTAIKEGYASFIGQLSTWLQDGLEVVLVPEDESGSPPPAGIWVMTAPRRDLLRDLDLGAATAVAVEDGHRDPPDTLPQARGSGAGHQPGPVSLFLAGLDGEFRHTYSEALPSSEAPYDLTTGSGWSTNLAIGTDLGRTRWDLAGGRERQTTIWKNAFVEEREALSETVHLKMRHDAGDRGRLDMRVYYDHDSLSLDAVPGTEFGWRGPDRERHAWGYDAGWTAAMGLRTSLDLGLRYTGSEVALTGHDQAAQAGPPVGPSPATAERSGRFDAGTDVLETTALLTHRSGDHRVQLGVEASIYSLGGGENWMVAPSATQDPRLFATFGRRGRALSVGGWNSWTLVESLSFQYGMEFSHAQSAGHLRDSIVPRTGLSYTPTPRTVLRAMLSWIALEREVFDARAGAAGEGGRGGGEFGCRIELERALGNQVQLLFEAQRQPLSNESSAVEMARWDPALAEGPRRLYLSDAGASVASVGLALEGRSDRRGNRWGVGAMVGEVEGLVAATPPDSELLRKLTEGSLRYSVGWVRGRLNGTATDMRLSVSRLQRSSVGSSEGDWYGDQRIDFMVLQGLGFISPGETDWSLLLAYSLYEPDWDPESAALLDPDPVLRTSLSRVSGGLSIRF